MTDTRRKTHRNGESPASSLDFQARLSNRYPCETDATEGGDTWASRLGGLRLLSAKEAGQILGINPNAVYALWKKRLLDYWCIHGTRKTNLNAITAFLEATRNQDLRLDHDDNRKE